MEKHKCKLCLRNFSNGKALGGHMRSHMMNLPIPPKPNNSPPPRPPPPPQIQLSFEADSSSSPSSSPFYGLRENPKRSFRFTDPNQIIDATSIILQEDGESGSGSESSKNNPTGRRSKRVKKIDPMKNSQTNESVLSSSSDITTEEDVAFCLMLMSRHNNNNWKKQQSHQYQEQHNHHYYYHQEEQQHKEQFNKYVEDEDDEEDDEDVDEDEESEAESEEEELKPLKKVRGRYKCDTCNKVFRSYQALGGHRASHKKNIKSSLPQNGVDSISNHHDHKSKIENNVEKKIHECPICFREFSSGQALGGHKRTHGIGIGSSTAAAATITTTVMAATTTATTTNVPTRTNVDVRSSVRLRNSLLDLNFPADKDEHDDDGGGDDVGQIEGSADTNAEIVKS